MFVFVFVFMFVFVFVFVFVAGLLVVCEGSASLVMWQACPNSGQTFLTTTAGDYKKQPRFCILLSFSGIRYLL